MMLTVELVLIAISIACVIGCAIACVVATFIGNIKSTKAQQSDSADSKKY